jgi:hypothetical protein
MVVTCGAEADIGFGSCRSLVKRSIVSIASLVSSSTFLLQRSRNGKPLNDRKRQWNHSRSGVFKTSSATVTRRMTRMTTPPWWRSNLDTPHRYSLRLRTRISASIQDHSHNRTSLATHTDRSRALRTARRSPTSLPYHIRYIPGYRLTTTARSAGLNTHRARSTATNTHYPSPSADHLSHTPSNLNYRLSISRDDRSGAYSRWTGTRQTCGRSSLLDSVDCTDNYFMFLFSFVVHCDRCCLVSIPYCPMLPDLLRK